ncbi:SLC13 family permease [Marinicauda algicola]|uniref:SLC13 family permease n=1 Tax=Marinicauda algicola TaxID=2029849 RepID=A0A4S2GXP0_9PROT|nr:SLC13 family permease [Marinicauda algicola]TGY87846.1 SLC13 family permease [Marinicauda algicola]
MEQLSAIEDWRMWAVLTGVSLAIVFYCWERFSIELVSAVIVAASLVFFHFVGGPDAGALLAGFANPALITILALLVIGQGIFQTGALEGPTRSMLAMYDVRPRLTVLVLFLFVFAVSAFINNTPVVVMFIPILGAIAAREKASPSLYMMPLSFVCILAGMTTLIGSSTNLLVAESLRNNSGLELEFFTPTLPGLVLASFGLLYVAFILPYVTPKRADMETELTGTSGGKQYIAQIEVDTGHPLIGQKPVAGMFPDLPDVTVRMIQRGENAILPPFDDVELQRGDVVIIAATRKTLTDLLASRADFLKGMLRAAGPGEAPAPGERLAVTEAIVSPGSRLIGRTIRQIGFRHAVGAIVLGVQRRSRMFRARMGEIRLEAGDVLLLFGSSESMRKLRADRDLLLVEWATSDLPDPRRAMAARVIFGGVILAAASGLLPIVIASVLGAAAMLATGCLNVRQAARAVDIKVYLLIGSAFALGTSLQATGGAEVLAWGVVALFEPFGTVALLSALFFLVAALTNVLSNNATAILFTPIALNAAEQTGADPILFALTVLFAANTCFATPIGYQTNLLVMGPGKYKFTDFVKAGLPLSLLIWIVFTVFVWLNSGLRF